mmetsp:Transcript_2073/g.4691  ORF Transcript_2073/g.4691 Transcript_2073/m.4691 type:complete len:211 (+) Transcript_2073:44-676(+)
MSGDLGSDIEKMKEKMKTDGASKPPANPPPPPPAEGGSAEGGGSNGKDKVKAVPRDPAESLKMMLTDDGVDAVRPGSDAEEQIKKMEKQVRLKMKAERDKMLKEQQRLLEIQHELDILEMPMKRDVSLTRDRLEVLDRELAAAEKDHKTKKKAYEDALALLEKKKEEKVNLADHLRMIIHDNEQRKTQKLEELLGKLGVQEAGPVFEGFS